MGVHGFQEYIEKHCPNAVVPVELQKLARGSMVTGAGGGAGAGAGGSGGGGGRHRTPQSPLRLLVDAENCLHRLYGGFYTDWVSGGQWNHMLGYLAALARACAGGNIQLLVCFNGALEKGRLHEWAKRQVNERQTAQQIVSHVQGKGTPPPKVWFLPPVCMAHCVRLALLRFRIGVVQSIEDHHLEVIALCRDNGFHGLVAYDSDYALVNMPCYFSAHALKLSRNGKSLTTSQYLMHLVAKRLHLNPSHFIIFASLLGNHILPDEDLAAFHWSLLGPEHPLASLKVRAHQLVLPPCDVVIKAVAEYVRNVPDTSDLDTIAKDIFRHSQSCTADKVLRFRKAVEYYMEASKPTQFPSQTVGPKQTGAPATVPQGCPQKPPHIPQAALIGDSGAQHTLQTLQTEQQAQPLAPAAGGGPPDLSLFGNIPPEGKHTPLYERSSPAAAGPTTAATTVAAENHVDATIAPNTSSSATSSSSPTITSPSSSSSSTITSSTITSSSSENDDSTATTANHVGDHKGGWDKNGNHFVDSPEGELEDKSKVDPPPPPVPCPAPSPPSSGGSSKGSSKGSRLGSDGVPIPSLLSMATRSHMDVTLPPLPPVAPEVLRVAEHRHRKGLMYPYIYHLLTKGEIKMSVTIEDEGNKELPAAVQLFRPVRQYVYGVLFSLAEAKKKAERTAMRRACPPEYSPVMVKEWAAYKGKPPHAPELVEALPFREWTCPNLRKLWLGKAAEDKNRRMRAFLACMRSDTPAMLSPTHVPAHLLVLCCVLRFMLHWPGVRILRRNELDAFLAQALSPKLYEPEQLQDLKIDSLDPRGVQLGALFMTGVDMALFANDACGQPIPWENCCPWMYFDGKLFQSKLIRAGREKAQLIDLCDGQAELAGKVEKMRQSILEGLNFSRPPHPMPFPPPPLPPPPHHHVMPFFPPAGSYYPPPPMMPPPGRARVVSGLQAVSSPGGKLEIAGTVVGQWAGSRRGRGRGGFPIQVVSVGGPNRGRLRGVISTPVIRAFGRGARYHSLALKSHPTFLGPKHTHVSAPDVKERKKTKPEEEKKKKSDPVEVMGHGGVENGVEDGKSVHVNGEADAILPGSAFSSPDAKACNTTNPYLTNALNLDGGGVVEAVLASEE